MNRRALVTLPDGVWKVIDKDLKGKLGDGDSEVIRNIVIGYLMERGYPFQVKNKKRSDTSVDQIASELDIQQIMIESLAELLEDKGIVVLDEWDKKIQQKTHTKNTN